MTQGRLFHAVEPLARSYCHRARSYTAVRVLSQRPFSTSVLKKAEFVEEKKPVDVPGATSIQESAGTSNIVAAPEIDFDAPNASTTPTTIPIPARIIPASPSYFTGAPQFNDSILHLRSLVQKYETLPTLRRDEAPRRYWLKLAQYRSKLGEPVSATRYSRIIALLARLNRIRPDLQPAEVQHTMTLFLRPSSLNRQEPTPPSLDIYGRARGMGRRKESQAQVYLVEGTGEVIVNGRSLVDVFPRMHDRESALWALKITERLDKYNIWATAKGGGVTGQAESVTLALAKALLVHEPALKPVLRRAGCITSDKRRVERKKPGRLKARKKPAWVKR